MMKIDADWLSDPRAQAICKIFADAGHQIFFVGGCVRNQILGAPISDIDLATDARPEQVLALAQRAGVKTVPTGVEHGTVTLVSHGLACEVTTFRKDVETDGRRAVVQFSSSIHEDALRRDFTMNALYADAQGNIIDPLNGMPDLIARRVRFIEDAEKRIREDYLRSLRFFRFHAWYGDIEAGLDADGLAAIAANLGGLDTLSRERVGQELLKLLAAPNPAPALAAMEKTGVLIGILPGASAALLPVLVHLEAQAKLLPNNLLRLACIGGDGDLKQALRLSKRREKYVSELVEAVEALTGPSELAYRISAEFALDVLLLRAASTGQPLPDGYDERISKGAKARFPVKSADLMPGLNGSALGKRLKNLEQSWIASDFALSREEMIGE